MKKSENLRLALVATLVLAVFFVIPQDVLAQSFNSDPFQKGQDWLDKMATSFASVVTSLATMGGMIVIAFAMAGKLQTAWAVRIIGGLIALTGLTWIVESITK